MASTQLTSSAGTAGPEAHPFLAAMIKESSLAPGLVRTLLKHYINRQAPPPRMPVYVPLNDQPGVLTKVGNAAGSGLHIIEISKLAGIDLSSETIRLAYPIVS
jgi:hypothetical protein